MFRTVIVSYVAILVVLFKDLLSADALDFCQFFLFFSDILMFKISGPVYKIYKINNKENVCFELTQWSFYIIREIPLI